MKSSHLFLSVLLVTAILQFSCQKEVLKAAAPDPELITKITSWLDSKKASLKEDQKNKIESLRENLNFQQMLLEPYRQHDRFIVVPLNNRYKSSNHKDKNQANYLVLVLTGQGEITKGNVIQYISETNQRQLPKNTFSGIFTYKNIECSGLFTVLSLADEFLWELKFDKGRLKSVAERSAKRDTSISNVTVCTDWYLITTIYYADGTTSITEQYLFTTCGEQCQETREAQGRTYKVDCGGGGGGGNNIEYEYAVSRPVTWTVSQYQTYWHVQSQEKLDGKRIASEPQGGHFTGISHLNSYLVTGNYSAWEQYSAVVSLDEPRLARAYVTGKITYYPVNHWEVISNEKSWSFNAVF